MKKVIGCIVKCALIIAMYFAIQFLVNMVINIPADIKVMSELAAQGMDTRAEETINLYYEKCEEITQANLGIVSFISASISVLIIFGIVCINRRSAAKKEGSDTGRKEIRAAARRELGINKINVKTALIAIFAGAGLTFLINGVLNVLPIPEWILESYSDASSGISNTGFIGQLFGVVLAPAIAEEVLFRGVVLGNLKKVMPVWAAVILSSIAFGLVHGNLLWICYAFVLGVIIACADLKLGSIIPGMIMHFIFNFTGIIFENIDLPGIVFAVLAILGAVVLAVFFRRKTAPACAEYVQPEGHGEVVG